MLIARTPFRISFFGGGTDYPEWYRKEGGRVLSTTIDRYCYLSCRVFPPFFAEKHRIVWSHIETVSSINEILHPAVREGLKYMGFDDRTGVEIHHQGDIPARAGMGSSSAFAVGLINALSALSGTKIGKMDLALKAIELERDILKECVGSQDQMAVAHGGLNVIHFGPGPGDNVRVEPVVISDDRREALNSNLMLFYTGTSRLATHVARSVVANLTTKQKTLRKMMRLVDQARELLASDADLDQFGAYLHEAWELKKDLSSNISNDFIHQVYERARAAGAIGGKLLGAGVAGFMVFYVPQADQEKVKLALYDCLRVPFGFESEGSTIMYRTSEGPVPVGVA